MTTPNVEQFLLLTGSGFLGGLVAQAIVAQWTSSRERAAKLMEDYLKKRPRYAEALAVFDDPSQLSDPLKVNLVTEFGNWFDIMALLCKERLADRCIVRKAGLDKAARRYYVRVAELLQKLPDSKVKKHLQSSFDAWTYLNEF